MSEAMKCLCNIIFNSPCAQVLSTKNHSLEGIVVRLQAYKNPDIPHDTKFFTMKMLFLITALGGEVTPQLKSELVMYLTDTLDFILKEAGGAVGDKKRAVSSDIKITVSVSTLLMSMCV
jgi:Guanine nucleotide exchange factor synembryn.